MRERVDGIGKGLWAETQTRVARSAMVLYVYGANKTRYLLEQPLCYATAVCRSLDFGAEPLYTFYNCLCVLVFCCLEFCFASNHKEYK